MSGASYSGFSPEGVVGEIFDIGVSAGIGGWSNGDGRPWSINIGAGKYAGVQINFVGRHLDGFSLGLGLWLALPVSFTVDPKADPKPEPKPAPKPKC
jgi:hypothetical protein